MLADSCILLFATILILIGGWCDAFVILQWFTRFVLEFHLQVLETNTLVASKEKQLS